MVKYMMVKVINRLKSAVLHVIMTWCFTLLRNAAYFCQQLRNLDASVYPAPPLLPVRILCRYPVNRTTYIPL